MRMNALHEERTSGLCTYAVSLEFFLVYQEITMNFLANQSISCKRCAFAREEILV